MRYVTIFFLVTLVSSCSWSWPWGGSKTGNCLDDGTCEGANPFEEELIGGTWHCYGVSRKEPWDCSQEQDDTKIIAVKDTPARVNSPEPGLVNSPELELVNSPEPDLPNEENAQAEPRAEMALADTISSSAEEPGMEASTPAPLPASAPEPIDPLSEYSNTSFAIQLIALQTLDEVTQYAEEFKLNPPMYVKIRSQDSDWYAVLLGIYEAKTQADTAAEEWASSHNSSSRPWVRPIKPLKKAASLAAP